MSDVRYVRNPNGDIHSVDAEHLEDRLHVKVGSRTYIKAGWDEVTEAEARTENPQLFGLPDPNLRMTSAEIKELRERRAFERELAAEQAELAAEIAAVPAEPAETTTARKR